MRGHSLIISVDTSKSLDLDIDLRSPRDDDVLHRSVSYPSQPPTCFPSSFCMAYRSISIVVLVTQAGDTVSGLALATRIHTVVNLTLMHDLQSACHVMDCCKPALRSFSLCTPSCLTLPK